MIENEQIPSGNNAEAVRKELDPKIESKVSKEVATGLMVIISAIFFYAFQQINTLSGKIDDHSKKITVIETKMEDQSHPKK
jgi:hypothetical protein